MVPDNKVKLAGVWLISAGLLNFGIAFLMYGERGIENRVLLFDILQFLIYFSFLCTQNFVDFSYFSFRNG